MNTLTKTQERTVRDIYKERAPAVRLALLIVAPFGIFFAYALSKVIPELAGGPPGAYGEMAGYAFGIFFLSLGVISTLYLFISYIKVRHEAKMTLIFKIESVVGVPKVKETFYSFPIYGGSGHRLGGLVRRVRRVGHIDGVKYNFWAMPDAAVRRTPMRYTAITKRSVWLGCDWNRFVIEFKGPAASFNDEAKE